MRQSDIRKRQGIAGRLPTLPIYGNKHPMGKNTSISLGDHYEAYARRKVESGEFATISEVIRDALRQAEEKDRRTAHLRALIREGEESGEPVPFDWDAFLVRKFPNA